MPDFKEREQNSFLKTYNRLNVIIDRGEGCYLYTFDGRKILDMFAGLSVNLFGYNDEKVNNAIHSQLNKYLHISNYFYQKPQIEFAEKLLDISKYSKLFLCNSGTEATEAAIKLIRKFNFKTKKKKIISFSGSFHGRTIGALSLTQRKKYKEYFEPLIEDVIGLNFNSETDLDNTIDESTAAVFLEFIQGEGGVIAAENNFISKLKDLKEKYKFILVSDEIQTGLGRTGKLFAYEHYNIKPDIILTAKGIGGGLPLGAVLVNENLQDSFSYGDHGSTFGGNPTACAAGLEVLKRIDANLMMEVKKKGDYLINKLLILKNKYPDIIKDIKGKGLMIGIEMQQPCQIYVDGMLSMNVLINCTNFNVIRLLPPLIIKIEEINYFLERFEEFIKRT
jgi:acetylornithine/N-succinyldiaminopimelate aminotransferase